MSPSTKAASQGLAVGQGPLLQRQVLERQVLERVHGGPHFLRGLRGRLPLSRNLSRCPATKSPKARLARLLPLPKPLTSGSKAKGRFGKPDFRYLPCR